MADLAAINETLGGFDFQNCQRNEFLAAKGLSFGKVTYSGTTICGCVVPGAVCLAADTRSTAGAVVADKNCQKIHKLAANMYCCGAGTAADLEHTTDTLATDIELHRLATNRQPRVVMAVKRLSDKLFKYQGNIGCALVLGGYDVDGPHLYQIYPHGSTDSLPFTTMGSGSLAAMSVMESRFRDGMSIEEGKQLVVDSILAGIFNDLGSGSNVDVCIITKDGAEMLRNYVKPNERIRIPAPITFPIGTTPILQEDFRKFVSVTDADGDGISELGAGLAQVSVA
jgi:20S proteasome subunit beta 2